MTKVGVAEARTRLPELLRRVEAGESIVITRHGQEVAHLISPPHRTAQRDIGEAVSKWKQTRKGVKLGGLKVRDLISKGHR